MILNVYKPKGWTSFDVVAKLKGILKTKKVGHAGTLDPLAEGVLIVLTDNDTKKQAEIMSQKKEYVAEVSFGVTSPTYDLEFPVSTTDLPHKDVNLDFLKQNLPCALAGFEGEQDQKAPAFSAKKVNGTPLYKKARANTVVNSEIPVKRIHIYNINIQAYSLKEVITVTGKYVKVPTATIFVQCSSGTYIRSLAHDLGEKLECGGVMSSLIRTRVGEYDISQSKKIESIAEELNDHNTIKL